MKNVAFVLILVLAIVSCQKDEPSLSSDKDITEFNFLQSENPGLSSDAVGYFGGDEIHFLLPAGTAITSLKPSIIHTGVSISPAGGALQDFTGLVEYIVSAEDRSTRKYFVSVFLELSSEKELTSFSFLKEDNPSLTADVAGTISGNNIVISLPAGTDLSSLTPAIVHTGISIDPASGVANDFSSPVEYLVIAEDGSSVKYTIKVTVRPDGPVVYVVGGEQISGNNYARLWTNGVGSNLTNGAFNAYATSVFVSDNMVYVGGNQRIGNNFATNWVLEDGVIQTTYELNTTSNDAEIHSVYVSESKDVYIAGQEAYGLDVRAKVWKNWVPTVLTPKSGAASKVFVEGEDVYAAGWELDGWIYVGRVWKNGESLPFKDSPEGGNVTSVFVKNGVVYAAGYRNIGRTPVLHVWIDGEVVFVNEEIRSEGWSIFVEQSDIYLAGREVGSDGNYHAKIWKNGVGTFLSTSAWSEARSIYVHNGDVYVAGWEYDDEGKQLATLWKNGERTILATNAFARDVMIK
jgi:hypothetical protein